MRHELQFFLCSFLDFVQLHKWRMSRQIQIRIQVLVHRCIDTYMQLASVTAAQFWIKLMQQSRPPPVAFFHVLCPCRLGVNDLHLKTFSSPSILRSSHFTYPTFVVCQKLSMRTKVALFGGQKESAQLKLMSTARNFPA